tara:strand:+ start:159 stop:359 length:201 start_codon:yes stop_codon:yes gene_type:complete
MKLCVKTILSVVTIGFFLASCEKDGSSNGNEIIKCQQHCSQRSLFMDYDQTQLLGRCFCDVERIDN